MPISLKGLMLISGKLVFSKDVTVWVDSSFMGVEQGTPRLVLKFLYAWVGVSLEPKNVHISTDVMVGMVLVAC